MKRIVIFLTAILTFFATTQAQTQPQYAVGTLLTGATPPKHEVRAVWLTTKNNLDWPRHLAAGTPASIARQQKELTDILDKLQRAGINIVLLQTRVRGTTIYPSAIEPWDDCLTGTTGVNPGYDALAFAIEECHKRGMELHAWVVTIPVGKWNGKACSALRKKYPSLIKKIGDEGYMTPESSTTGDYIASICEEITKRYDIDGIHLDYIRYPETWKFTVSKERGRQYITDIVRKIHQKVKAQKAWVKVSCSPVGKYDDMPRQSSKGWNAYTRVCQDAQGWLRMGLMDILFPMMYFKGDDFYPFALDWQEHAYGRLIAPGLGIYFMSPREKNWKLTDITQEMAVLRTFGMGHTYFRSQFFTDNTKGLYTYAANDFDRTLALVPAMTWEQKRAPSAPTMLSIDDDTGMLAWGGATDNSGADYLTYNIYCSTSYPVDTSDPNNLVAIRHRGTAVRAPMAEGLFYAVTAMDRYGNESAAIQQQGIGTAGQPRYISTRSALPFFDCDGQHLTIGTTEVNRSDLLLIETLQGIAVKSVFQGKKIDVSDIPEGVYIVRSIGKKNARHRLGFFEIRRTIDK